MADKTQLTAKKHQEQIQAYAKVRDVYKLYAEVLKRVFENACSISFPEALVQTRAKTLSSFAEKVARKFSKYTNAVQDMTDLCGGRVIVQTTEQVLAVRRFIEANFTIIEADNKTALLSKDTFGYRDMHYIVQLREDSDELLSISPAERASIGDRKAEIQVRTWVQHAWADTLHDRIYKNPLKSVSSDIARTGALLSALLEESDRAFKRLADELDGLITNYTAIATEDEVEKELKIQQLVLDNEPDEKNKPALAMKLAKLALACGKDAIVVNTLEPHVGIRGASRCELLSDLGFAYCRIKRSEPTKPLYSRGIEFLDESLCICRCVDVPFVPHLRKNESLHARALARLAWAMEVIPGEEHTAREFFHQAHEHEPANPYYLANMLGFEMYCSHQGDLPTSMRTTIREAIRTCHEHAIRRIELPWAFFTAGRLSVLLGKSNDALSYYARGIGHCLEGIHCIPETAFDGEIQWLTRLHFGMPTPGKTQRVIDLLKLGKQTKGGKRSPDTASPIKAPVLIIAGGAASIDAEMLDRIHPFLKTSLEYFQGTVIAGGTNVGVPGRVGDVAGQLAAENRKQFQLVGYGPAMLPQGVSDHPHYDHSIHIGDDFSPDQILRNWADILAAGIEPRQVMLLGMGGGPLSAVEYRIALGLGASVGIVMNTGGAADELRQDGLWSDRPNLYPLPFDSATVRSFIIPPRRKLKPSVKEAMAKCFHEIYVAGSTSRLPANMRPWSELDKTFKTASMEQAKYSVAILEAAGFAVTEVAEGEPDIFEDFTDEEVNFMAEMEHGRWNVERLRNGWRYGKPRDDNMKIHDCIVRWEALSDDIKSYDIAAVCAFPSILAEAGLEITRKEATDDT